MANKENCKVHFRPRTVYTIYNNLSGIREIKLTDKYRYLDVY